MCDCLQCFDGCSETKSTEKNDADHWAYNTCSPPSECTLQNKKSRLIIFENLRWINLTDATIKWMSYQDTFCSSSLELLCVSAREILEMNRLKKLYNVCHATTSSVKLWVKWSRVSSAISNNSVIKHTNCSLIKKYILILEVIHDLFRLTIYFHVIFSMILKSL